MTYSDVISLMKIISGVLGSSILFSEVYMAQTVEKLKARLETLDRTGVIDKLRLFKTDYKEYSIQSYMEIFKITRDDAEIFYDKALSLPQISDSPKQQMDGLYKVVDGYFKKTSPRVLRIRRILLITGFMLILLSAILELYGILTFPK